MDVRNQGNAGSLFADGGKYGSRVLIGNRDANDITACLFKSQHLLCRALKIVGRNVCHRLNAYGGVSSEEDAAYVDLTGGASHNFSIPFVLRFCQKRPIMSFVQMNTIRSMRTARPARLI